MNRREVEQEFAPLLEQQRKSAVPLLPVANGLPLTAAQQCQPLQFSRRINTTNPYEDGFTRKNGRYE